MDFLQVVVLAIVQGITEFLPISSSGHLILVPQLFGWDDQGLAFDAAIHIGTLAAIVVYFRVQLGHMASAWLRSVTHRELTADARLGWAVRTDKDSWVLARDADAVRVADLYRSFAFDAETWGIADADLKRSLRDFATRDKEKK